jgi:hypothetical protein
VARPNAHAYGAASGTRAREPTTANASRARAQEARAQGVEEDGEEGRKEERQETGEKGNEEENKPLMPQTGHFILHSNVLPQLTAGHYQLVTDQTGLPFDVAEKTAHVTVSSPRFTMPTDQILSTFPPANAEGAFGDRLPQIVLKRRTLPWERNPAEVAAPSPTPWLALIVVAEGEAELSSATAVADCVTPGTTLLDPGDHDVEQGLYISVTQTVLDKIFPTQADLALLTHVREVDINDTELANGDDDGWLAVVLANRLPVADEATGNGVRYMACLVNVEGQLESLPKPKPPVDRFTWELAQDWRVLATVDASAVPDTRVMGGLNLGGVVLPASMHAGPGDVHVAAPRAGALGVAATTSRTIPMSGVSIDGTRSVREHTVAGQWASITDQVNKAALDPDAKRLVRDRMAVGFRLPIEKFALEKTYRFPVLAHWSFTTNGTRTFEVLMRELDVGLLGTIESADPDAADSNGAASTSTAPPARPAPEVVETGHIGLGHRTRRGDATRAWYRGPFVPFPTKRDYLPGNQPPPLAHDADQLRRVVPDGREDLSLAAAFEIGRLLGVSQLSVVSALLRFRAEQFGAARLRELLSALTDIALPPVQDRIDLGRFVALDFVGILAGDPAKMLGPRRAVADPGRPLDVKGNLDQVIAEGLGIDLNVVRRTSKQLGIVQALAQARVPVANPDGSKVLDARGAATLRGAVDMTLNQVANVAAPPKPVVIRDAHRPRDIERAAAPADALDELIERAAASSAEEED